MTKPLTIKRPNKAGPVEGYTVIALTFLPLGYLRYLSLSGRTLHSDNTIINVSLHLALILLPLLWAAIFLHKPFEYQESEETILERQTFFSLFKQEWWMMLMLWSAPFFCLIVFVYEAATGFFSHVASWTTTPISAFATLAIMFLLSLLFGKILRTSYQLRVSEEGFRCSQMSFYEWSNIAHFARAQEEFALYHRVNPLMPITYLRLTRDDDRKVFLDYLAKNNVAQSEKSSVILLVVKCCVVFVTALLILLGLFVFLRTGIDIRWIVVCIFVMSIAATIALEQVRKIGKVTKFKPVIEPVPVE